MTDHPTDDFDELLRSAARDYNRPGEVPRERMWTEIRAERARRSATSNRPTRSRRFWILPFAAAAVLILGIAIGRVYEHWQGQPAKSRLAVVKPESTTISPTPAVPIDSIIEQKARVAQNRERAPRNALPSTHNPPPSSRSQPFSDNSVSMAYRLAVLEHLAGTEAMLTSFRASAKRGEVDAQITTWARNLLTTTRLLQASAAQDDPVMKRLLDDLELVLVQIAQYTSAGPHRAEELELIEHSIERRGVIGKLHTTIPARLAPAGT